MLVDVGVAEAAEAETYFFPLMLACRPILWLALGLGLMLVLNY